MKKESLLQEITHPPSKVKWSAPYFNSLLQLVSACMLKHILQHILQMTSTAVARTLIGGGGGGVYSYSCSARLVSFEIKFKFINLKRIKLVGQNMNI